MRTSAPTNGRGPSHSRGYPVTSFVPGRGNNEISADLIVKYGSTPAAGNHSQRAQTPTAALPRSTSRRATAAPAHQPVSALRFVDVPTPAPYFEPQPARPARVRSIPSTNLTWRPTNFPTSATIFTAVDLETTGLDCEVDQIVEIGLAKFAADGRIVDELATLVNNPGSCREARDKHQINDNDLIDAPSTGDAHREAFSSMAGTVLVAHNFDFEEGFLTAAARRERIPSPRYSVYALCRRRDGNLTAARTALPSCTRRPPENSRPTSTPHSAMREPSAKSFSGCWPTRQRACISCTPHPSQSQPRTLSIANQLSPSATD